ARISTRTRPDGTETPYEANASYFSALGDGRHEGTDRQIAAFLCSQTIPLSLAGVPAVYLHSFTATPNDLQAVEATGRARSINRRKWDAEELEGVLADTTSPAHRVFTELAHRLRVRAAHPAFHPAAPQRVLDLGEELFALERTAPDGSERVLALHNVQNRRIALPGKRILSLLEGKKTATDLLHGAAFRPRTGIALDPFQALWLIPA
ncbi:MAG: alpha-amylase, partial [Planctomycetota bacterium]